MLAVPGSFHELATLVLNNTVTQTAIMTQGAAVSVKEISHAVTAVCTMVSLIMCYLLLHSVSTTLQQSWEFLIDGEWRVLCMLQVILFCGFALSIQVWAPQAGRKQMHTTLCIVAVCIAMLPFSFVGNKGVWEPDTNEVILFVENCLKHQQSDWKQCVPSSNMYGLVGTVSSFALTVVGSTDNVVIDMIEDAVDQQDGYSNWDHVFFLRKHVKQIVYGQEKAHSCDIAEELSRGVTPIPTTCRPFPWINYVFVLLVVVFEICFTVFYIVEFSYIVGGVARLYLFLSTFVSQGMTLSVEPREMDPFLLTASHKVKQDIVRPASDDTSSVYPPGPLSDTGLESETIGVY
jgi:hypothetical protein